MTKLLDLQQWPFNKLVLIYFLTFLIPLLPPKILPTTYQFFKNVL